jgi:hypothetical protein
VTRRVVPMFVTPYQTECIPSHLAIPVNLRTGRVSVLISWPAIAISTTASKSLLHKVLPRYQV